MELKEYWDSRYKDGEIWGNDPCPSAISAEGVFKKNKVKNILVPGCGYGRNSVFFAKHGYYVNAYDLSEKGISIAKNIASKKRLTNVIHYVNDIYGLINQEIEYDAIYLSNVIHLFKQKERIEIFNILTSILKQQGIFVFTCISTMDEKNYGHGIKIEENTFEQNGKILHFFDKEEIILLISQQYEPISIKLHTQTEKDPNGQIEDLILWEVIIRKR